MESKKNRWISYTDYKEIGSLYANNQKIGEIEFFGYQDTYLVIAHFHYEWETMDLDQNQEDILALEWVFTDVDESDLEFKPLTPTPPILRT